MQIQEAVVELKNKLEEKHWVLDVVLGNDSGGFLIEVHVNAKQYPKSDPIDRTYLGFPVCVVKIPSTSKKKVLS